MQYRKTYIAVIAHYDVNGNITPIAIEWADGRRFEVERVLDVRRAASLKAGGLGIRYTIRVLGQVRAMYLEGARWYVEEPDHSQG